MEATVEDASNVLFEGFQDNSIRKILVPIDGSACSDNAVKFAVDLAVKYNSEICLVHIIPNVSVWNYCLMTVDGGFFPACAIEEIKKAGKRLLSRTLALVKETGVKADAQLYHGHPAKKIVQIAEEREFDLIVIGSNRPSLTARLLLWNISDKVTQKAPCPVLVVKEPRPKKGKKEAAHNRD